MISANTQFDIVTSQNAIFRTILAHFLRYSELFLENCRW